MRLLEHNNGEFRLAKDFGEDIPRYAILSHTWGPETEEVTFKDLMDGTGKKKAGYDKIRFCGEQAGLDGLQYFWVDTCCIDKSSSTELAEAINSMFYWYRNAAKCYVYLSDVFANNHDQVDPSLPSWRSAFQKSRWFTRGWTLQELIAPLSLEFFCSHGRRLGDKKSLERQLHEITGIALPALRGTDLSKFSIDERMSWRKDRETKREEDKAYSLLGIFNVHMSLLYGKGASSAFIRLQNELHKPAKKHQRDNLSTVSQTTFDFAKRLKTSHGQSLASGHDPNRVDPEPLFYSEFCMPRSDAAIKQSIIEKLNFAKINERLTSVTAAQGKTCRWFLAEPEYLSWNDMTQQLDHSGLLWIKGNPGAGKSTLMKLLIEEAKLNTKGNSSQISLSFLFLAKGTVEENSTTGLYRSLLHQLFEKAAGLRDILDWMTVNSAKAIQRNGWSEEALKQTLAHAVRKLGSRSLAIFVDGLDECDKNQIAGMVSFFEELCNCAKETQVRLQICFSSRYYPTVVIEKGIEVALENKTGHTEEIEHYIKSKLMVSRTMQGYLLQSEILEKSSGIFLWVILILNLLNSEYPQSSSSVKEMRKRLEKIPPGLTDLYEMISTRDGENLERLQVCLKWIPFATCPLKPPELYFAIQLSLDRECSSCWNQNDIQLDQMKTFVRSSSKGLVEFKRNKDSEVHFIHESIRDFLLGKYKNQWSRVSSSSVGHGHESLKSCCLAQLNAPISQCVNIPDSLPLPYKFEGEELRKTIDLKFPFLKYSVLNVLHHANGAQQSKIKQERFLANFPLKLWISLNNIFEVYNIRRYTESVSFLYILAEKNLADLIRIHPQRESCFEVENERYGPPIFAALATGSDDAVRAILDTQAETQPLNSPLHSMCRQYCQNKNKWTNLGRNFTFSRQRTVISYVAEHGDEILFTFLLESGKHMPDSEDESGRTPLSWAAGGGHQTMVEMLLEKDAKVDSKDKRYGRTPLWWAVENGHEAIVQLLLEKGASIETEDKNGRTPLLWAADRRHEAVVQVLLKNGANIKAQDKDGRTMLLWAVERGHKAIVQLILEQGGNIEPQDKDGRTPLSWAAGNGYDAIVQLLLRKGANTNFRDKDGRTPLMWAVDRQHEAIVQLLLEKGANVEAQEMDGRTSPPLLARRTMIYALHARQNYEMQMMLLEQQNKKRLMLARQGGHERTVLDKGADIEAQGKDGRTSLPSRADRTMIHTRQDYEMQILLLEQQNKKRPMLARQEEQQPQVVDKAANIEAHDMDGRTSLS